MNVYCFISIFSFIHNAIAFIEIRGELAFDIRPINAYGGNNVRVKDHIKRNESKKTKVHDSSLDSNETTTEVDTIRKEDCIYQFPDRKQVEALLSDMMNQLTKIFVRAYDYMGSHDERRGGKRFKIVNKKFDSKFFENAYNMMTKEYRQAMNTQAEIEKLSTHNPCHHQPEIKQIWRNLLEHSRATLRRAAVRCLRDFLRVRNRADDTRTKEKLGQLLVREIKEVRSNQLKVLCDDFDLCYTDLL